MSYLPWLAGGALAGYLHRKGAQGRRDVPFPMPPQLDLSSITVGAWTAVPVAAPKEDRWGTTTKLWDVVGPQKGFSLWRYWPKSWGYPLGANYTLRMKKGSKWIGHVQVEEVRQGGENAYVVSKSHLDEAYRGTGLGSMMYLAARNMIEAYKFKPAKMISTKDYGGSGTSPMAQKVWDRLRGEGRLSRGRRNIPFEGDDAHPRDFGGLSWLYHHTSEANIPRIARHGLMGGDGRNWDDPELVRRSTGRVYFTIDEDRWAFGDTVPLRARPQDVTCQYDHNWELMFGSEYKGPEPVADWRKHFDCYVTLAPHERISPRLLQILDEDEWGNELWVPLVKYAGRRGRRGATRRSRGGRLALKVVHQGSGREGQNRHLTRRSTGTLPTSLLLGLKGARGEHGLFERSPTGAKEATRWREFVESVRRDGVREPVFVVVEWTDDLSPAMRRKLAGERLEEVEAFVYEGNHRIRAAQEAGLAEVPVEVSYFGHAERHKGLLGGKGRRAQDSSFERDLASANVFLMDWVCDGWGKLPPKIQRIADKVGALTAAEKRALVQWFRDTAPGNYS